MAAGLSRRAFASDALSKWLAPLLYLLQLPLYRGYVTDDSYIYARFAHNLALHGELAFNPGQPVHAATSPLWATAAALPAAVGLDPILALRWGGMACGLLAVLVFVRLSRRILVRPEIAALASCVFATEPWMVRWSTSGMETALGVLWILLVLDLGWRPPERVRPGRWGILVGMGFLVRPEFLLFSALAVTAASTRRELRTRPALWLGAVAPALLWGLYALPTFGHLLPATLQAKSTPLGLVPSRLWDNLRVMGGLLLVAAPLPLLLFATGLLRSWRRRGTMRWLEPALWVWSFALPAIYLLRDVQVVSRYLEAVLPVVLLLGLREGERGLPPPRARLLFAAQVLLGLTLTVLWIAPHSRAFGRSLEAGLGDLAAWVRAETDDDALIAIYDIGLMGHHTDRPILDLGGLVHPGINDLRNRVDDEDILRRGLFLDFARPEILVDRDPEPRALDGMRIRDLRLEAVLHRQVANLGLSRPDPVVYTLYRVVPDER